MSPKILNKQNELCLSEKASTDVLTPEQRSRCMSNIKSKNTKPELKIAQALLERGFQFRTHDNTLPGKPDFVVPEFGAVIFVHGCFWHCHKCHLFKWPTSRPEFWRSKLARNVVNDQRNERLLKEQGWWMLKIWECTLKGKKRVDFEKLIVRVENWVKYEERNASFSRK